MPRAFKKCVREGGRVRTLKPKGRKSKKYMPVCFKGGKSYAGEVKMAKGGSRKTTKKRRRK